VYTFSTKSLKVVDSVSYSGNPFDALQFTSDGKYACYSKAGVTWVTDYASGDTVAIDNEHGGPRLSISKGDRMLLVLDGSRTSVFGIPNLNILYTIPSGSFPTSCCFDPTEDVAYLTLSHEDSLLIVRLDSTGVHDHKIWLSVPGGNPKYGMTVAVSSDGSTLLLNLTTPEGLKYLELRDTDSLHVMAEYYPSYYGPIIHPDGRRAFLFSAGTFDNPQPSVVYVLDLKTRIMQKVLDGVDYGSFSPYRRFLDVGQIDFTPDGRYAFILNGHGLSGSPPIAKLDLESYEIVDAIYPPSGVSRAMRIYPLEISYVSSTYGRVSM
jgi:hypothetical protein